MAQAYFIGGAPRVGKSTLAHMLARRKQASVTSTDMVRTHIRKTTTAEAEPDLFYLDSLNVDEAEMARLMREQTADIIAAADREHTVVWKAVEELVRTSLAADRSIIVEGVAVMPEFVAKLKDLPHTAVYMGNQSPAFDRFVVQFAATHPNTWLGSLKPLTVSAFAAFCRGTSTHVHEQAQATRQTYIEMSDTAFEVALNRAMMVLQSNKTA
ncbi:MAG TPA: hypothetical protein VHQ86_04460 [Candidatus Saccharimonadia bacterium]|jgi:2-phosphoglycerate kinase|nr:hypothetical protein [Candidatus Saccharimonadia bacterium]